MHTQCRKLKVTCKIQSVKMENCQVWPIYSIQNLRYDTECKRTNQKVEKLAYMKTHHTLFLVDVLQDM